MFKLTDLKRVDRMNIKYTCDHYKSAGTVLIHMFGCYCIHFVMLENETFFKKFIYVWIPYLCLFFAICRAR